MPSGPPSDARMAEAAAARVLRTEGEAVLALADRIPPAFADAVDLLLGVEAGGRAIVSGMGKSGHVGRKIAATLASTGTPAQFVHPGEASHGDLGMVTSRDVCVLISNSGETTELGDLIAHCRRFDVPIVAICRRPDSTLARAATHLLLLPDAPEACPIGMAPTTSTTMTLALGDALAVAVMERRGMRPEDFGTFHPGGKLGARLKRVGDLMIPAAESPVVGEDAPMGDTIVEVSAKGFGIAIVAAPDGTLAGVITDGDLRRRIDGLLDRTAGEVATRDPVTVTPDTLAADAVRLMQERKITVLIVAEAGRPVGLIRILDCLRAGVV
ncbi:KpsF/GutQ family sugar-phosphate isomerase [Jannaschia sp. Os4]|nr:KpsF/GutQ family sugar-phosphate isomerase [Jannaschia sp. Os4]